MFQGSSYDHFSILIFPRHEYLISQILTFLYSMHFFQYTCKVKLLQRTSFHGYRLMIKSSNYKTLLIFPGSRIFSLFPEFQVIFDFLEFQKKAVCHPCIFVQIHKNARTTLRAVIQFFAIILGQKSKIVPSGCSWRFCVKYKM